MGEILDSNIINELNEIEEENKKLDLSFDENYSVGVVDPIRAYLMEIGKYPLLSPEEEKAEFQILNDNKTSSLIKFENKLSFNIDSLNLNLFFVSLINTNNPELIIKSILSIHNKCGSTEKKTIDALNKYKKLYSKLKRPLNRKELKEYFNVPLTTKSLNEKEFLQEYKKYIKYKQSFYKIFNSNLRLVVSVAKKFQNRLELLELVSEGNLALMKAIDKFDESLGFKFSTYATWWIKQSARRSVMNQSSTIRLPVHFISESFRIQKEIEELEKKEKRKLSPIEICKKLNISMQDLNNYTISVFDTMSLDTPVGEDFDQTLVDFIEDDNSLQDEVFNKQLKEDLIPIFEVLDAREKYVIDRRYGVGDSLNEQQTLSEIGEDLNITRERVRQIEVKALQKMKKRATFNSSNGSIKDYLK